MTYQAKPNCGGQCNNNNNNNYNNFNNYNNQNNSQGFKNNTYKGKQSHNNGPKVQYKFCFGPREIFQICKLLDEHADNPDHYKEVKSAKSTAKFIKNRNGNSAHINEMELESLAELMNHPIEHVIHKIAMFVFPEAEEKTNLNND